MGNEGTELSTRRREIETTTVAVPLAIFAGQPFPLPEHSTYRKVLIPEGTSCVSDGCIASSSKEHLVFGHIPVYCSLIAFHTSDCDL